MSNRLPQLFADSFFPAFAADPFADENFFRTPTVFGRHADRVMKTDIRETENAYVLDAELPGFSKEDIHAEVRNGYLTIHAEHKTENEEKDEKNNYLRRERSYGSFARSFDLDGINSDEISASYKDGILTLTLPKATQKAEEGRRLEIQ